MMGQQNMRESKINSRHYLLKFISCNLLIENKVTTDFVAFAQYKSKMANYSSVCKGKIKYISNVSFLNFTDLNPLLGFRRLEFSSTG